MFRLSGNAVSGGVGGGRGSKRIMPIEERDEMFRSWLRFWGEKSDKMEKLRAVKRIENAYE